MASLFKDKPPFKTNDEGVDNLVRNMRLACASVENRFAFFLKIKLTSMINRTPLKQFTNAAICLCPNFSVNPKVLSISTTYLLNLIKNHTQTLGLPDNVSLEIETLCL